MRRVLLLAGLVIASVASAACGDSSTGPTVASIAGTYNLQTVNGAPLPYVLQPSAPKIEIVTEQVIVNSNGTWTASTTIRTTNGSTVTNEVDTASGTVTVSGSVASFKDTSDGSVTAVSISDNKLTIADSGLTLVFAK